MKIAQKLGLLVGSLLLAMTAQIAVLSFQTVNVAHGYDDLLSKQIAERSQVQELQANFLKHILDTRSLLFLGDDPVAFATKGKIIAADKSLTTVSSKLIAETDNIRIRTGLTEFQTSFAGLSVVYGAAFNDLLAHKATLAATNQAVDGQEVFSTDLLNIITAQEQSIVVDSVKAQKDAVRRNITIIIVLSVLLLLLAIFAVTLAIRGITKPVRSLTAAALDVANTRLPKVVAQIAALPADAEAPELPRFTVTTKDELSTLASALTTLQDRAVGLALDQRRDDQANAETLVNLGRRNQSLLTRMLSYVTELERGERDSDTLDKLFRLDHLTTRIRRNAESLLVLAGAKQTRTWSQPIAMDDVLRAALSEIEEYTRVTVHHADTAKVHGGVAADLTHMIAELLENATRFSPREKQVLVVGRLTPSGYQFDIIDSGLGMSEEDLVEANERIAQAGQRRPDTKVLGHHVVGRIAARRGIFVRLLPSVQVGITAQVLVPIALLSEVVVPVDEQSVSSIPPIISSSSVPAPSPDVEFPVGGPVTTGPVSTVPADLVSATAQGPAPMPQPVQYSAPQPVAARAGLPDDVPAPRPAPEPFPVQQPAPAQQFSPEPASAPSFPGPAAGPPALPTPRPETQPAAEAAPSTMPGRRVRGAQLESYSDLQGDQQQAGPTPVDAQAVRSQMSSLQSGVAAARNEFTPQPIPYTPITVAEQSPPVPTRRVRGARIAELGPEQGGSNEVPARDPAAIGRQLSGLQAATARARLETTQNTTNDDTNGSQE